MNKFILISYLLVTGSSTLYAQKTLRHDIALKISPCKNDTVYLANYFGNGKNYADTAILNLNGEGHFKGKRRLTPGMYFLVSPKNKILVEFLLDSLQHFSIRADTTKPGTHTITGSAENDRFKRYTDGVTIFMQQRYSLYEQLKKAVNKADKEDLEARQLILGKRIERFRDSMIREAPESLTSILLNAGKPAELPVGTVLNTHADSIRARQYLKKHYWDDVAFNDDRLLYTPFFEAKIDNYYRFFVSPVADSVIAELQNMILYSRTGKEMYPYLLMKFTNQYFNAQHTGQNKVLLYLFNSFYLTGDTVLLNPAAKKLLFDRVYQLMANQTGDKAPPLDLTEADGKPVSLYKITSPYTLIIFWDPSCSHCQKELPRIDSIYRARWKALGVTVYCVNVNKLMVNEMNIYIKKMKPSSSWIIAYQTDKDEKAITDSGQLNYLQLYDIADIPTLYLLDSNKRIMAKGLSIEQLDHVFNLKPEGKAN